MPRASPAQRRFGRETRASSVRLAGISREVPSDSREFRQTRGKLPEFPSDSLESRGGSVRPPARLPGLLVVDNTAGEVGIYDPR